MVNLQWYLFTMALIYNGTYLQLTVKPIYIDIRPTCTQRRPTNRPNFSS